MSVMATTRRTVQYHCVVCASECVRRSITCVDCGRLTHIDCVGFADYVADVRPIDFVCRQCVFSDNDYDWEKALIR